MSELIDRNVLKAKMYQEAFESDTDMQKWDSECWIRYKLFEKVVDSTPTVPYAPRWHRCEDELPESNDAVNVVWANRNPESYYADIKDKPFVATAHYHKGKWYWFSATCKDFLDEYGRCEVDEVDKDIDILYWMPLPSQPVNKLFTK